MAFTLTPKAEKGPQGPFRTVDSPADLLRALEIPKNREDKESPVKAAICEAPLMHQKKFKEQFVPFRKLFNLITENLITPRKSRLTTHAAFDEIRDGVRDFFASSMTSPEYTHPDVQKLVFYILDDLEEILTNLTGYRVTLFSYKGVEALDNSNHKWHQDSLEDLNLLRTYSGPSTEYALDGRGNGKKTFAKGSIALHTNKAWHRAPKFKASNYRFAVDIRLVKIED